MCEVTRELLAFIKSWEGVRRRVYRDTAGYLTVGVGHLIQKRDNLKHGDLISDAQVDAFLAKDIQIALGGVNDEVKVPLTANQCIALTSWTFNFGVERLKGSDILRLLNTGASRTVVAGAFRHWVFSGGKRTQGLVNRREAERKLFLT